MKLADAHIHLFRHGYRRAGLPSLLGDRELESYEALRKIHGIELALAIGYEAEGIDPDNNAYIRQLSASRSWLQTLAYVDPRAAPNAHAVGALLDQGHRGLALYVTDAARALALLQWPREVWQALAARRAIVSFNAPPEAIVLLKRLVASFASVSFLFSHLGLPGKIDQGAPRDAIQDRLQPLLALAALPNAHVKISGHYATSEPEHAYPHRGAYHAIHCIIEAFGSSRCLWASDFAPALEFVSFPQTIHWPGFEELTDADRQAILRGNLVRLLFNP
jgi:L-fuconolactonase